MLAATNQSKPVSLVPDKSPSKTCVKSAVVWLIRFDLVDQQVVKLVLNMAFVNRQYKIS